MRLDESRRFALTENWPRMSAVLRVCRRRTRADRIEGCPWLASRNRIGRATMLNIERNIPYQRGIFRPLETTVGQCVYCFPRSLLTMVA